MADASKNLPSERQIEQLRNWKAALSLSLARIDAQQQKLQSLA
jgi:hypothetical protein